MARRRKSGGGEGGGDDWMNTYADMVTLLLCFFVLLYSMSTIDQQKWAFLLQSLNPEATLASPYDIDGEFEAIPPAESDITDEQQDPYQEDSEGDEGSVEATQAMEDLYLILKAYVEENDLEASVELQRGDGLVYITFRDSIFFDGNSSILKEDGKVILEVLAGALEGLDPYVGEVKVLGHTSQADPGAENDPALDRTLSSGRAVEVLLYLQLKDLIEPGKYSATGYGQFYPVDTFETAEGRAKNRRVEIIIVQNDERVMNRSLDNIYGELGVHYGDEGRVDSVDGAVTGDGDETAPEPDEAGADAAETTDTGDE